MEDSSSPVDFGLSPDPSGTAHCHTRKVTMQTQLDRHCQDVLHSKSVKDLLSMMTTFSEDRGFGRVSATVATRHSATLTELQYITNASPEYMPEFEDLGAAWMDPVSRHVTLQSAPLVWDQATYVDSGQGSLWERQAPYGYRSGIVIGFHLPRGRHFLFGPDSDQATCTTPALTKQMVEDFHLFGAHAQAAAFDLCLPYRPPSDNEWDLTKFELEPLRWSMDGMTNWEIANRLGLSERDVARRLQRAADRLGCATKYETVLRAIKFGLIKCT